MMEKGLERMTGHRSPGGAEAEPGGGGASGEAAPALRFAPCRLRGGPLDAHEQALGLGILDAVHQLARLVLVADGLGDRNG